MTIDELVSEPCIHCGRGRKGHVGQALVCFGGYGTVWSPKVPDERDEKIAALTAELDKIAGIAGDVLGGGSGTAAELVGQVCAELERLAKAARFFMDHAPGYYQTEVGGGKEHREVVERHSPPLHP